MSRSAASPTFVPHGSEAGSPVIGELSRLMQQMICGSAAIRHCVRTLFPKFAFCSSYRKCFLSGKLSATGSRRGSLCSLLARPSLSPGSDQAVVQNILCSTAARRPLKLRLQRRQFTQNAQAAGSAKRPLLHVDQAAVLKPRMSGQPLARSTMHNMLGESAASAASAVSRA